MEKYAQKINHPICWAKKSNANILYYTKGYNKNSVLLEIKLKMKLSFFRIR